MVWNRKPKYLAHLRVLALRWTAVTDEGLKHLRALPRLEKLGLEGCRKVSNEGAELLRTFPALREVRLVHTNVSEDVVKSLKASLKNRR